MTDPNRTRNLTRAILGGIALGVALMALLVANADSLREMAR